MKMRFAAALMMTASLGQGWRWGAAAQTEVDTHVMAAQTAAGTDFAGTLSVLCIQPSDGTDPGAGARAANAGKPRADPGARHLVRRTGESVRQCLLAGHQVSFRLGDQNQRLASS
jgi:hypothetical protein